MKRIFQITVVLLLIGFLLLTAFLESQLPVVKFTETQVQEKISGMFPITGDKTVFNYTFSNPKINFLPGGNVSLISDVQLSTPYKGAVGIVKLQAKPTYKPSPGEFFLYDPKVTRFQWDTNTIEVSKKKSFASGLKKKLADKMTDLKPVLEKATPFFKDRLKEKAVNYFESKPIYTLKTDSPILQLIKLHVTDIRFNEADLELRLNWAQNEVRLMVYLVILILLSFATIKSFRTS